MPCRLLLAALRMAAVDFFFRRRREPVQQRVGFHPKTLAPGDLNVRTALVFLGNLIAKLQRASRRQRDHFIGKVDVVLRGFGISKTAQSFNHVCLRVGLAAVNDVVNRLRASKIRMVRLALLRSRSSTCDRCRQRRARSRNHGPAGQTSKVIGDVLADIGNGSVGTDDHLGVFVHRSVVFCARDAVEARRMTQQPWFLPSVSR